MATDPAGVFSDPHATVTITIKDVNEAPMVSVGPTKVERAEGDAERQTTPGIQLPMVGTYEATDTESTAVNDCMHQLPKTKAAPAPGPSKAQTPPTSRLATGRTTTTFGQLAFKNAPDFENPADADMDNVYEITVKVTDNGVANKNKMSATRDVMITVTNDNEVGEVTFSSVQPKVGRPFTATLNDPDGMTTGVTWQWWRTTLDTHVTVPEFPAADEQGIRDRLGEDC